ncbi:MAG: ferrous iron transport protein A [Alphaproteobacteria bacterium]|jgi:Fe2+ transport system protein FeoA|nr:ferrous iron transport protein A [Alphaproteobacteria bacterium]
MEDSATIFLSSAKVGKDYIIVEFSKKLSFYEKDRLASYGFVIGNSLKVLRKSIMGNTFEVSIIGSNLVIRKKEADSILLQEAHHAD